MKVTAEHLAVIREAVTPHDTPERRERYRAGAFPRADRVQDLDKRYRWDLFHVANDTIGERNRTEHRDPPTPFLSAVLYDAGYHDGHIDTALRAIVPPLLTGPQCVPCADGEHADDGTGAPCPCCGARCEPVAP